MAINPPPGRLIGKHLIEKIPPNGKKAKPQRKCAICTIQRKRKETIYWCPDCQVGLCFDHCFKEFHTKVNL
jgi:predicted nucleic acid binding AN1-type Zn finger protein